MNHLKVKIVDESATHQATEIMNSLLTSSEKIQELLRTPWYLALREINRRYECATYNQDGEPWIYIPKDSHDAAAMFEAHRRYPGILEIQEATAEEVAAAS